MDADLSHIEAQLAALALQKRKAEVAASAAAAVAAKHAGLLHCTMSTCHTMVALVIKSCFNK